MIRKERHDTENDDRYRNTSDESCQASLLGAQATKWPSQEEHDEGVPGASHQGQKKSPRDCQGEAPRVFNDQEQDERTNKDCAGGVQARPFAFALL